MAMEEGSSILIPTWAISQSTRNFLNNRFKDVGDIARVKEVEVSLKSECLQLESELERVQKEAAQAAGTGFGHLKQVIGDLDGISQRIESTGAQIGGSSSDRNLRGDLIKDLSTLAAEVARVEQLRTYAEAALKLERLVGELEEAVSTVAAIQAGRKFSSSVSDTGSLSKLTSAVKIFKEIEESVANIAKSYPQWERLIFSVDTRVDRAAAALRPIAIADHRNLLSSIGWPPPLSSTLADKTKADADGVGSNPLFEMHGKMKEDYKKSFTSLSSLQVLQAQRRKRQHGVRQTSKDIKNEPLWTIEELVAPIASKANKHFRKWLERPELVFALAYQISLEHIDVVDTLLQPMLDESGCIGYNAREEWISDVAAMVSNHIRSFVLPQLLKDLDEDTFTSKKVKTLWLHTVDQTILFDKKVHSRYSGLLIKEQCISVFADRVDWLELWSRFEFEEASDRLKAGFGVEKAWSILNLADARQEVETSVFLGSTGEFHAPLTAISVMAAAWGLIDRCRNLCDGSKIITFIRDAVFPIFQVYREELLRRCHESEASTALADEGSMGKVAVCINAAHYCQCTLQEWGEDIFFIELKLLELKNSNQLGAQPTSVQEDSGKRVEGLDGSIFDEELERFIQFEGDWISKLVTVVLRGFDVRTRDYIRNKKQWSDEGTLSEVLRTKGVSNKESKDIPTAIEPSLAVIEALAVLQNQLKNLERILDEANFSEFWRKLATGLDQSLLHGLVLSGAKFSPTGKRQFAADVYSLFSIFKPFCVRPERFFTGLNDAVKLLTMSNDEALDLMVDLSYKQKDKSGSDVNKIALDSLRKHGIRKITPLIAEKIISSRS